MKTRVWKVQRELQNISSEAALVHHGLYNCCKRLGIPPWRSPQKLTCRGAANVITMTA
jgi:hypothetical protein